MDTDPNTKFAIKLVNWKGYFNAAGMPESFFLDGLKTGVVATAIYVNTDFFNNYSSGIITYQQCLKLDANGKPLPVNHAVNVVGYG